MDEPKPCSIEDCERPMRAKGLCGTHLWRLNHGHDLTAPIERKGPAYPQPDATCSVDGCARDAYARGMCGAHYQQWRRDEKIKPVRPFKKRAKKGERMQCTVEGCEGWARGNDMCTKHYQRWKRYGDPLKTVYAERGTGSVNADGYRRVLVDGKRILEHRHVMEQHLGRPLLPEETVHHGPGGKLDNRIENLELWSGNHPCGQRVEDLVEFAFETLRLYRDLIPREDLVAFAREVLDLYG